MKKSKKILIILILIIIAIICSQVSTIFARTNNSSDITAKNNYIKNKELTYRKEENGETLISGFKIGEKVSEILNGKFGEDYEIKIKNSQGTEITNEPNTKIGTGNKIELYPKTVEFEESNPEKTYTVVIYGDANGNGTVGAVDALAVVKNKIGKETFTNKALEEAGRAKVETRISGVVPKADDALYIIKYKLYPEQYPIDQKMIGTDEEEKIENGDLPEQTEKEIKITFNVDGEELIQTIKEVKENATYGELPTPTKEGYTFEGWYTSEIGGTKITEDTIIDTTSNQTLYAHWTVNNYILTVKHYLENANDTNYTLVNTTTSENITYGTPITLTNYATIIENGTYHHATLEENGTAVTETTIETNTTIYLYYSRNTYTLTLNKGENIATVVGTGEYKVGENVTIDATLNTEIGYTINWANWTSNNTDLLENNETKNLTITMPIGNVTLTANATKTANTYQVNFDANEGNIILENKIVTYNELYGELPVPSRIGHTFAGWYTEITGGTQITSETVVNITENQTLYAHWIVNNYVLTVKHYLENANNTEYTYQTEKDITENISYGTTINLANYATTIENGTYHHATLEENGTVVTETTIETNSTIYLYYSRNRYTLTLIAGENIATVAGAGLYKVGQNITIDATLGTETGHTISWLNWTSSDTNLLSNNSTKNATITMPKGNITLTANGIKIANIYTLTYNANNGTGAPAQQTNITSGSSVTISSTKPTREEYTFLGWSTSSTTTNAEYQAGDTIEINEETILYAVWDWNYAGEKTVYLLRGYLYKYDV